MRSRSDRTSVGSRPSRSAPGRRRPHDRQNSWAPSTAAPQRGHPAAGSALTPACPLLRRRSRRGTARSSGRSGHRSASARRRRRSSSARAAGPTPLTSASISDTRVSIATSSAHRSTTSVSLNWSRRYISNVSPPRSRSRSSRSMSRARRSRRSSLAAGAGGFRWKSARGAVTTAPRRVAPPSSREPPRPGPRACCPSPSRRRTASGRRGRSAPRSPSRRRTRAAPSPRAPSGGST